MMHGNTNI